MQTWVWGFGSSKHGSIVQSGGISAAWASRRDDAAPAVGRQYACCCFQTRWDETRQLAKVRSEEALTGGRQACAIRTERLWSGCSRSAAIRHIWPMAHSWTPTSVCSVPERRPAGSLHCRLSLTGCVHKPPVSPALHVPSPWSPPDNRLQTTRQTASVSSALTRHEQGTKQKWIKTT